MGGNGAEPYLWQRQNASSSAFTYWRLGSFSFSSLSTSSFPPPFLWSSFHSHLFLRSSALSYPIPLPLITFSLPVFSSFSPLLPISFPELMGLSTVCWRFLQRLSSAHGFYFTFHWLRCFSAFFSTGQWPATVFVVCRIVRVSLCT